MNVVWGKWWRFWGPGLLCGVSVSWVVPEGQVVVVVGLAVGVSLGVGVVASRPNTRQFLGGLWQTVSLGGCRRGPGRVPRAR